MQKENIRSITTLHEAPLYSFNEHELDSYLKWLAKKRLTTTERVAMLGRKCIGQPYRIYLLGEFPYELYDPDPMYCLSASDCVTFVEQTYAMALSNDWPSFFRTLQRIRYKDGQVGILTRNHFTEADWNVNNRWLFAELTESVANGNVEVMNATIDRAAFFAKRQNGLGQDMPRQQFTSIYIRREDVSKILPRLRTGDIIEFVKGNEKSQYVGHMGLVMYAQDGSVTLLHSASPAVLEEPLLGYIDEHTNIMGVKILRLSLRAASI